MMKKGVSERIVPQKTKNKSNYDQKLRVNRFLTRKVLWTRRWTLRSVLNDMLEVEHPTAKVLVELAELEDREVGDGTTSMVIVAAELLKRAIDLLAMQEACKYVEEKLTVKVEKLGKDSLIN